MCPAQSLNKGNLVEQKDVLIEKVKSLLRMKNEIFSI